MLAGDQHQALRWAGQPREHPAQRRAHQRERHDWHKALIPKWLKNSLNACITPAVRLSSYAGTTQLIAKAGRMKISSTRPVAMNIAFGNSLPGLRSDETCTEFISIPE